MCIICSTTTITPLHSLVKNFLILITCDIAIKFLKIFYSNGDIAFTMPDELYTDNFYEYLKGNMDLDDFIKESNRKLDVFLNE